MGGEAFKVTLPFNMHQLIMAFKLPPEICEFRFILGSGPGGQHVNKTDSAVRLTHVPTGTVVQCQNDRSQHKNKDNAFKQLKSKLYELELQKQKDEQQLLEDSKSDIGWGSQIRSYVLDQSRIKDLRTNVESGNISSILDGDIDIFIKASLTQGV